MRSVVVSGEYLSRAGLLEVIGQVPEAVVVAEVADLDAARGYCVRGETDLVLVDPAVVVRGGGEVAWLDKARTPRAVREAGAALRRALVRVPQLSPRELDVLRLLGSGLSNRALARQLHVTERTAKGHVASILTKLGLESRLQAGLVAQVYAAQSFGDGGGVREVG